MSNQQPVQVGRLAMRHEGELWNAYYALPDSMAAPVFLGSIRIGAVVDNQQRKLAFMEMMRDVVGDIIQQTVGVRPVWGGAQPAPEHERSGHG